MPTWTEKNAQDQEQNAPKPAETISEVFHRLSGENVMPILEDGDDKINLAEQVIAQQYRFFSQELDRSELLALYLNHPAFSFYHEVGEGNPKKVAKICKEFNRWMVRTFEEEEIFAPENKPLRDIHQLSHALAESAKPLSKMLGWKDFYKSLKSE